MHDFNFQLYEILRLSTLSFGGSPLLLIIFYSNLSGRGVPQEHSAIKSVKTTDALTQTQHGPFLLTI